jgi:serine/threonine protein kinase
LFREISILEELKEEKSTYFPCEYSVFKIDGGFTIEYKTKGVTLRSIIGDKQLMYDHGMNIMKMLNEALGVLRKRGFAHRHLTPDNILVTDDFMELQLIDFHKCHHKNRFVKMQPGSIVPYWHAKNEHWAVATHNWDLMAFGVIGFEMMIPADWWGKIKNSTSM